MSLGTQNLKVIRVSNLGLPVSNFITKIQSNIWTLIKQKPLKTSVSGRTVSSNAYVLEKKLSSVGVLPVNQPHSQVQHPTTNQYIKSFEAHRKRPVEVY